MLPQMKPINWIFLFSLMNLMIMFMNIKNFYMKNISIKQNQLKNKMNSNNWKW